MILTEILSAMNITIYKELCSKAAISWLQIVSVKMPVKFAMMKTEILTKQDIGLLTTEEINLANALNILRSKDL